MRAVNIVDIFILLILAVTILGGWYKGFLSTLFSLIATVLAWGIAMLFVSPVSSVVKSNDSLYQMLLYYTEGSEYVAKTDVELTRVSVSSVSPDTLEIILDNADMPLPMADSVSHNIAVETFAEEGYTTLGDYFNLTIVSVVIHIAVILALFLIARLALGFVLGIIEHGRGGFPTLVYADSPIGAGVGLLHGITLISLLFMLLPIALTVLPRLYEFVEESFFGEFFYRANIFIRLIPAA